MGVDLRKEDDSGFRVQGSGFRIQGSESDLREEDGERGGEGLNRRREQERSRNQDRPEEPESCAPSVTLMRATPPTHIPQSLAFSGSGELRARPPLSVDEEKTRRSTERALWLYGNRARRRRAGQAPRARAIRQSGSTRKIRTLRVKHHLTARRTTSHNP